MLIRTFGHFWNPDAVYWGKKGKGNKGKLMGKVKVKGRSQNVDFWEQQGLYVLLNEFQPVYVGKVMKGSLGKRLRDHLTDRLAGRWDMFSWYGLKGLTTTGKLQKKPGMKQVKPVTVAETLEAFGIMVTDPPLNRKRESLPSAREVEQETSPHPHAVRHYLEQILSKLEK